MGLYDQKHDSLKLRKDKEYIIIGIIVFVIIIIIGLLATTIDWSKFGNSFKASNISVKFSENPYSITKDKNLSILVTVKNNSGFDVENSEIIIDSVETSFFVMCSASETGNNKVIIPIMSKDSSRIIDCAIKVSPTSTSAEILPGTYNFDVIYILNNTQYSKRATLTIRK